MSPNLYFRFVLMMVISSAASGVGLAEEINHAKFLAQRAAMSALEGPSPFTLRESWMNGTLTTGQAKLVPRQLFKGNTYQFWFAVPDSETELQLNLYDKSGRLMEADTVKFPPKKNVISMIISPEATGTYYLRLALTKPTSTAQSWALIYAYK